MFDSSMANPSTTGLLMMLHTLPLSIEEWRRVFFCSKLTHIAPLKQMVLLTVRDKFCSAHFKSIERTSVMVPLLTHRLDSLLTHFLPNLFSQKRRSKKCAQGKTYRSSSDLSPFSVGATRFKSYL